MVETLTRVTQNNEEEESGRQQEEHKMQVLLVN
jgi:hypothetical protein